MRYRKLFTLYKVKSSSKKPIYHFRIWSADGTKRISHSTGCTSKERAYAYALNYVLDPAKKESLIQCAEETQKDVLFKDFAKNWWKWDLCPYVLARRRRGTPSHPGIKRSYTEQARRRTELYLIPYLGREKLESITPQKIEWFLGKLKTEQEQGHKTINNIRFLLNIMCNEAVKEGKLKNNPVAKTLPMYLEDKKLDILTNDEAAELLDINNLERCWKGNITYYGMSSLAAMSGMRIGEIRALKIQDICGNELNVDKSLSKYGMTTTKTSEKRRIPISDEMKKFLIYSYSLHASTTDFVFSVGDGPVAESGARDALKHALAEIGISEEQRKKRGITFHKWRDFFTTICVASNISTMKIKKVTGHKSDSMVSHYTNLRQGDTKEILEMQEALLKRITKRS